MPITAKIRFLLLFSLTSWFGFGGVLTVHAQEVSLLKIPHATPPSWQLVVHKQTSNNLQAAATRPKLLFDHFLKKSLHGSGKQVFFKQTKRTKNKISWSGKSGKNHYNQAFRRAYPTLKDYTSGDFPEIVFLIPYMESLWRSKGGKPSADYGYWQLVPEVVKEIQTLDYVPKTLKAANINTIRSNPNLSTQLALIHLRRYYFYFAKVAKFSETDAWLLTIQSYNWGAGNVKRLLAEMEKQKIKQDFANFYHFLYQKQIKNPSDKSLKAAVNYLPSLYNIAVLIKKAN
ncbi:MAG: transglycosylase SLT domain-containing protein [bacterium]